MEVNAKTDVIVIGAGAAGLMCAAIAGQRGRKVWLIDHATKIAEKIRISGGGRCNFTNLHTRPENFLSSNPHFCRSALARYKPQDFIKLVEKYGIAYHEKKLGQLFCDGKSQEIIDLLLAECAAGNVELQMETNVHAIEKTTDGFRIKTNRGERTCQSLVIATGGLSIPKIGATKFGYDVARQFGLNVLETRAGLVPLTFTDSLEVYKELSGLSVEAEISYEKTSFAEGLLFTHRGLSGPSILQISSYWREGHDIIVNLVPEINALNFLKDKKQNNPKQDIQNIIGDILPKRLAQAICEENNLSGRIAEITDKNLKILADRINRWRIRPSGTEGYRTAEVTLGGVDTRELSSQTMMANNVQGLFFIGEVVDVTGHLGGFNFQWAWASGHAAGQNC
ncbi:MAG TPA: aminoacetone oxidase family FAD-binding enzyme [Rhodospirillaceae bacterium]|nr:aminoacetone oxidase family FAD-binding enzyme [Rhodospirillaceae bacterium]